MKKETIIIPLILAPKKSYDTKENGYYSTDPIQPSTLKLIRDCLHHSFYEMVGRDMDKTNPQPYQAIIATAIRLVATWRKYLDITSMSLGATEEEAGLEGALHDLREELYRAVDDYNDSTKSRSDEDN